MSSQAPVVPSKAKKTKKKNSNKKQNRLINRYLPRDKGSSQGMIAPSGLVQYPELTHRLTENDRGFLYNFLDPCDERVGPSSCSKVPDGTLSNSGITGLREAFNVHPPFEVAQSASGPLGGPVWTLVVLRLPLIRNALILVASDNRDELSFDDQDNLSNAFNNGLISTFPVWTNIEDPPSGSSIAHLRATLVQWSLIRQTISLNALFNQVRITKFGITAFHNAPDLYNQGMVMTAQWNCDLSRGNSRVNNVATSTGAFVGNFNSSGAPTGGVIDLPDGEALVLSAVTSQSYFEATASASSLGGSGSITITNSSTVRFNTTDTLRFRVYGGGVAIFTIDVLNVNGEVAGTTTRQVGIGSVVSVQVTWRINNFVGDDFPVNDIELPPLDTQSVIQSTPKAIYLPLKQYNGVYNVGRVWEPIFNMQESDTQAQIRLRRRSQPLVNESSSAFSDLVDLNFGTIVQVHTGVSLAASIAIKIVMDIEFVAGQDSPWQGFMNPNVSVDTQVISYARAVCLAQPFGYPQTYNSIGTLLSGLENLLSKVPIIGNVVPVVSSLAHALFGEGQKDASRLPDDQQIEKIIRYIMSKLNLK